MKLQLQLPKRAKTTLHAGSAPAFGTHTLTAALLPVLTPERLLRWSLGLVFLWFGVLKLTNVSPVLEFLRRTYPRLATPTGYTGLALFECALGAVLLAGVWKRWAALATVLHLGGTLSVLILAPHAVFQPTFPALNMEGEFVVKNLVLIAAAGALWVMGGELVPPKTVAPVARERVTPRHAARVARPVLANVHAMRAAAGYGSDPFRSDSQRLAFFERRERRLASGSIDDTSW